MAQRKPFVGGNWKCNTTVESARALIEQLNAAPAAPAVDVVVSPPFVYISTVQSTLRSDFEVAAQNCGAQGNGAFTGEVSADMLADIKVPWVIIGHSERRSYYGESDEIVAKKINYALSKGIRVIACCGETLAQRQANETMLVINKQLEAMKPYLDPSRVVIAYEPVWAIGTGVVASPAQAQEVHSQIRGWLASNVSADVAGAIRIIYGGSVTAANSGDLIKETDVDGFLVGGASLKPEFSAIVAAAATKH